MDDGLELAQYTMIDFRHGTKVDPVVLNNNQKTNLFQIVKMKNGKRSVAFLHFKFQRAIGFYVLQVLTCYF